MSHFILTAEVREARDRTRGRLKKRRGKGEWDDVVIKRTAKEMDTEASRMDRELNYGNVLNEGKGGSDTRRNRERKKRECKGKKKMGRSIN